MAPRVPNGSGVTPRTQSSMRGPAQACVQIDPTLRRNTSHNWPGTNSFPPAHDGQQTAVQDDDLFAKRTPDHEQRFDQNG
jgi:hypothetical protein